MPLPGYTVNVGDRGAATPALDDVSTYRAVVLSERGPVGRAVTCYSWAQVRNIYGDHTSYSNLRTVEQFFRQGGTRAILSRAVGPAPVAASVAVRDGSAATIMTIFAGGPGQYGNDYQLTVTVGSGAVRTYSITEDGLPMFAATASTSLDMQAALQAAGFVVTLGAAVWPPVAVSAAAFTGGTDDRTNLLDAQVTAAVDVFNDFLPSTLAAPGWTSHVVHAVLANRATARNWFALGTLPDVATVGTLTALAAQMRAVTTDAPRLQLFAGWPQIQVAGATVAIDPTGVQAGRMALADRENGPGPGQPAAWSFGIYDNTIVGVSQAWNDVDRTTLNDAGITVIRSDNGDVFADDAITVADPVLYPQYAEVAGMRVLMAIENQSGAAMRRRVMQNIDGRGHIQVATTNDLIGICKNWFDRDALYGETAEEAFSVSTAADAPARRLTAEMLIRNTSSVQRASLNITKVASGDTI